MVNQSMLTAAFNGQCELIGFSVYRSEIENVDEIDQAYFEAQLEALIAEHGGEAVDQTIIYRCENGAVIASATVIYAYEDGSQSDEVYQLN